MDDLKVQIRQLMSQVIIKHLHEQWFDKLVTLGINEHEANRWAWAVRHVVEEFESRLIDLAKVLNESDPARIPIKLHGWSEGVTEVTVPEIVDPMRVLQGMLQKYLPPEPPDEIDDHNASYGSMAEL